MLQLAMCASGGEVKPLNGSLSQTLQLKEGLGKATAVVVISRCFRDTRRPLVKTQKTPKNQARNKVKDHNE